jgi:tetratricopeptide (TPR) repeat protein
MTTARESLRSADLAGGLERLGQSSHRSAVLSGFGLAVLISALLLAGAKLEHTRRELQAASEQRAVIEKEVKGLMLKRAALVQDKARLETDKAELERQINAARQELAAQDSALTDIAELASHGNAQTLPAIREKAASELGSAYQLWQQGYSAFQAKNLAEAERLYRAAVAANPSYAPPYNSLGRLKHEAGELDAAEKWYRAAIERRKDYAPALHNLSLLEYKRGNFAESKRWNDAALAARPGYDLALKVQRSLVGKL